MFSFLQDRFKGGVTVGGCAPSYNGDGTYSFSVNINSATSIRKAYLMAGRCGAANPLTVTLNNGFNNHTYTFNNTNQVSPNFTTAFQLNTQSSGVHAIDITADISTAATNYTLTIPPQTPTVQRYCDFCLYISWNNLAMDVIDSCIFLNDQNIDDALAYNLSFMIPMDVTQPVGVSWFTGYVCNMTTTGNQQPHDPTDILLNSTSLGRIGSTTGDGQCGGVGYLSPLGNFSYFNSALIAGANCNINQAVNALDALSDAKALLPANCTAFNTNFNSFAASNNTNNLWGIFVTYTDTQPYTVPYECFFCGSVAPGTPTASNITNNSARISWCAQGGIVNWENNVQYRVIGNTVWTVVAANNVSFLDIAGLTTLTTYEAQVVNVDSDGALCSPSTIITFTTL